MTVQTETELSEIISRVEAGQRISVDEALALRDSVDLLELGRLAALRREARHARRTSYIINHHLNATNICVLRCKFCAFRRTRKEDGAYALTPEDIWREAEQYAPAGVSEFHMANGLNPDFKLDYYEKLLRGMKERFPDAAIKHFTAIEIEFMAQINDCSIEEVLQRLRDAGLDSLTGGGAETLSPRVRAEICKGKLDGPGYLDTHRRAHKIGMSTTCTLLFGQVETLRERLEHMDALRGLQDETNGFTSFVPLVFSPPHTELAHIPRATGRETLEMIALSRIMLDNFPSIKAYWISLGPKLAQVALDFGADDLDGTVTHEQIHTSADAPSPQKLSPREMRRMIRDAGYEPWQRDSHFGLVCDSWPQNEEAPSPIVESSNGSVATATVEEINAQIKPREVDLQAIASGARRMTEDEALALLRYGDLKTLARYANQVRTRLHPEPKITFNIDRNINPTNYCVLSCDFCAFAKNIKDQDGYVLDREQIIEKVDGLYAAGGRQVLMQSGLHPKCNLEWHEELFRWMKQRWPDIHLHTLSPTEIKYLAQLAKLDFRQTIIRLRDAGMASIPGGGAEILTDRMRTMRSPGKVSASDWIDCMRVAHEEGLRTTATMVLGLGETFGDCVEHMKRVRDLQDQTSGFTAFIAWTFQTENTPLEHEIGKDRISGYGAGAVAYLRMLAVARLYLDNIENMQSSWVTQGPAIGQLALLFGANDLGSTMLEENVVSAAGTVYCMDSDEMQRLAEDMGMQAVRRDFFYQAI